MGCDLLLRKGKSRVKGGNSHFYRPVPGITIEVRLYDEIYEKFFSERASVSDAGQMRRLVASLLEKGVDLGPFVAIRKV